MGRKTFESIGHPLAGRANIVISSHMLVGVTRAKSLPEAIEKAKQEKGCEEIFVIGGGIVFVQAIDRSDRLYLTVVDASADADTFFPDYSQYSKILSQEHHKSHGFRYTYKILEK